MSSVLRTEGRLEGLLVCSAFFFCRCGVIYCRTKDVTKVCTLTAQYSVQEPHAPQLFRFPLPQTLQLVSKSKPMEQAKSHGKRGILHVSLRRATLLTALARTGSPKASSCSKTSDGEQDPGGLLSMSKLLLHLSTSFYNQPLGFLHFCHQSLPASCLPFSSICLLPDFEAGNMSSSKLVVTGASEHGHGKVQEPEDGKGYSTMTLRSLSDLLFSPLFFFYWLQSAAPLKSFNCSLPFGWLFFLFFRGWRVFTLFGPAAFALAVCCGSMTPFPTT